MHILDIWWATHSSQVVLHKTSQNAKAQDLAPQRGSPLGFSSTRSSCATHLPLCVHVSPRNRCISVPLREQCNDPQWEYFMYFGHSCLNHCSKKWRRKANVGNFHARQRINNFSLAPPTAQTWHVSPHKFKGYINCEALWLHSWF